MRAEIFLKEQREHWSIDSVSLPLRSVENVGAV
jgi:hypothetical protein